MLIAMTRSCARHRPLTLVKLIAHRQYHVHIKTVQPLCGGGNIAQLGNILQSGPVQQRMARRLDQMYAGQIPVGFNVQPDPDTPLPAAPACHRRIVETR